jgi:hypothetical protein
MDAARTRCIVLRAMRRTVRTAFLRAFCVAGDALKDETTITGCVH